MKTLSIIFILLTANLVYSQTDTTYNVSVLSHYSVDRASASGEPFTIFTAEAIINKMSFTIVPTYRNKSINEENANQFGASVYKSFHNSYINIALFHSPDALLPILNFHTDYYKNIAKGIELRLGYNYRSYENGVIGQMGIIGLSYEYKKLRMQYNAYKPFGQSLSQQISISKLLKRSCDYLQISYTSGRDYEMRNIDNADNNISAYRLSLNKSISNLIQIRLATSLSDVNYVEDHSTYFGFMIGTRLVIR